MMLDNIVSTAEAAEILGMSRGHVSMLATRGTAGFPKPIKRLRCGPLYDRRQIEAWRDRDE